MTVARITVTLLGLKGVFSPEDFVALPELKNELQLSRAEAGSLTAELN